MEVTKYHILRGFFKVRVPTGKVVLELPAGMLDDDKGDFVGTAVREVPLCECYPLENYAENLIVEVPNRP